MASIIRHDDLEGLIVSAAPASGPWGGTTISDAAMGPRSTVLCLLDSILFSILQSKSRELEQEGIKMPYRKPFQSRSKTKAKSKTKSKALMTKKTQPPAKALPVTLLSGFLVSPSLTRPFYPRLT